jgi:hypothetical protein
MKELSVEDREFLAGILEERIAINKYDCDSVRANISDANVCDKFINERHQQTLKLSAIIEKLEICNCSNKAIIGKSADGFDYCENCRSDFEQCSECGQLFYLDNIKYDDDECPYCAEHYENGTFYQSPDETKADWGY